MRIFGLPLHVASLKEHNEVIVLLLNRTKDGQNILSWMAEQKQDRRKIDYFNTCIGRKAEASTVLTGLRATVQEDQLGRSRTLLEKGADVNAQDVGGWTASMMAVWGANQDHLNLLLEYGADANICGFDQKTALH